MDYEGGKKDQEISAQDTYVLKDDKLLPEETYSVLLFRTRVWGGQEE